MTSPAPSHGSDDTDPRVLVVCGDAKERGSICSLFENEGFETHGVETSTEAEATLGRTGVDLIILDGRFGDGGAIAVCRRLAVATIAPIIMISDLCDVTERVIALEVGADDLLSRPFSSRELLARARALVRRSRVLLGSTGAASRVADQQLWGLDLITRKLSGPSGEPAVLTPNELSFLHGLLERPGQPVTPEVASHEFGATVSADFLRTLAVRVRRKMAKAGFGTDVIRTLRGGGYYIDVGAAARLSTSHRNGPRRDGLGHAAQRAHV